MRNVILLPFICILGPVLWGCGVATDKNNITSADSETDTNPDSSGDGDTEVVSARCQWQKKKTSSNCLHNITVFPSGDWVASGIDELVVQQEGSGQSIPIDKEVFVERACGSTDGTIWAYGGATLYRGTADTLSPVYEIEDFNYLQPVVSDLFCSNDGTVYLVGEYTFMDWDGDEPPPKQTLLAYFDGTAFIRFAGDQTAKLNGIWAKDDSIYAVGEEGVILQLSEGTVAVLDGDTTNSLFCAAGDNQGNTYIGSVDSVLVMDATKSITTFELGLGEYFAVHAIAVTDTDVYVAVSEGYPRAGNEEANSTVLVLKEKTFIPLEDQPNAHIADLDVVNGTVYASGYREGAWVGTFDGSDWQDVYHLTNMGRFSQMAVNLAGQAIWVSKRRISHFDGSQWSHILSADEDFSDAISLADGRFFVVNRNLNGHRTPVFIVDGSEVTPMTDFPLQDAHLRSVCMDKGANIWVGGTTGEFDEENPFSEAVLVMKWDGNTWTDASPPNDPEDANGLICAGDDIYINTNTGPVVFRDGLWQPAPGLSSKNYIMGALSPSEIVAGEYPLVMYNGTAIEEASAFPDIRTFDVAGNGNVVLIAGNDGFPNGDEESTALLYGRFDGEWTELIRSGTLYFGSVAYNNGYVFAQHPNHIWWGTCR